MVQRANIPAYCKSCKKSDANTIFPSIGKYVRYWVEQRETCITDKRIKKTKLKRQLLNVFEWDMGQENAMQLEIFPELQLSGGYKNIVTGKEIFSRYAFAYPFSTPTAVKIA